jgi:hypothetical protein
MFSASLTFDFIALQNSLVGSAALPVMARDPDDPVHQMAESHRLDASALIIGNEAILFIHLLK